MPLAPSFSGTEQNTAHRVAPGVRGDNRSNVLRECRNCGLFQQVPPLAPPAVARCARCRSLLERARRDPIPRVLALTVAGLLMFAVATRSDFLGLERFGLRRESLLISGPVQLDDDGMGVLAAVVLGTTMVAPLMRLLCLAYVATALHLRRSWPALRAAFRWNQVLRPWSMVEVFLLGVLVAYTRLVALANVSIGTGVYALGALMLVQIAADASMDAGAVWREIDALAKRRPSPQPPRGRAIGCGTCGLVSDAPTQCPRCGAGLFRRKPSSVARTAALLAAAALLYLPANFLPVMNWVTFGSNTPYTIMTGVIDLVQAGMYPLALLVFFASITVPAVKMLGLCYLLIATKRGSAKGLRGRTQLYRIIEGIGRWSMIDVFMLSVLVSLVQLGFVATVRPGLGAICFAGVVVLTMLAASSFDPRLMWDAAADRPSA